MDSWRFQTGVAGPAAGQTDSDTWISVVNPLDLHQQGVWQGSFSMHDISVEWSDLTGIFDFEVSQLAQRVPGGGYTLADVDSTIRVTPSVDLTLAVSARYDYQMPSAEMSASLGFSIQEATNLSNLLYGHSDHENAFPGEPASGTFNLTDQILLPAGHQWRIHYAFRLIAFSGPLGPVGLGNGGLDFTLSPANIPEPAAIAPLALVALLSRRRLKPSA